MATGSFEGLSLLLDHPLSNDRSTASDLLLSLNLQLPHSSQNVAYRLVHRPPLQQPPILPLSVPPVYCLLHQGSDRFFSGIGESSWAGNPEQGRERG